MLPTIRRTATSVLCLVAVACASFAWMAIVYLHTWADPGMPSDVVAAVLADESARDEVVTPLRERIDSFAESAGDVAGIESAVDAVLADPDVRDRIAAAVTAVGDGGVDTSAARSELVGAVAGDDPAVAERLDAIGPTLSLPDVSPLASLRTTAQRWVWRLAFVATALFAVVFAFGDRRMAVRRYSWWAFGTGATWWIVPILVVAAARRWLPGLDATTSVVVDATIGPTRPWAIGLALSGVFVFVTGFVLFGLGSDTVETDETTRAERADVSRRGPAELHATQRMPVADEPSVAPSLVELGVGYGAPTQSLDDVDVWAAYSAPAPPAPEPTTARDT